MMSAFRCPSLVDWKFAGFALEQMTVICDPLATALDGTKEEGYSTDLMKCTLIKVLEGYLVYCFRFHNLPHQ